MILHRFQLCLLTLLSLLIVSCNSSSEETPKEILKGVPSIEGTKEYLDSPFVTAGDRVYMVGHQNGSFPELGWHITGEMGGIWNHPIKLMDGFDIIIKAGIDSITMDNAHSFQNFPFANKHFYTWDSQNIEIERHQFVPDGKEGVFIKLKLKNLDNQDKKVNLRL
ncbi:MAG: glycogen debranching protein, partial [Flavobacteriaceae bacterium]|nr:glycogen debranching protein [Flavobacteriaceae bacterium]